MMLDLSKPIQTRLGLQVRILATDMKGNEPIVAIVTERDGTESVQTYTREGRFMVGWSYLDLVNVTPRDVLKQQLVDSLAMEAV